VETNQLALRIRAFRKLKRLTQHELAEAIGISIASLGAIERGIKKPNHLFLHQISTILDIEPKEFGIPKIRSEE
jgi:transcriptional regulator with XRE-family HTH domain